LNKLAGSYQFANANKIDIKNEGGQLFGYFPLQNKLPLFANTDKHFYATHELFNLYFKVNNGNVESVDMVRYGSTQNLIRVK
jgi:hypothetical protein